MNCPGCLGDIFYLVLAQRGLFCLNLLSLREQLIQPLLPSFTQGFLFCALDYDFHVLNNAFLIHKPGIKSQKEAAGSKDMAKVTKQTNLILKEILPNLRRIVGEKKGKKCTF